MSTTDRRPILVLATVLVLGSMVGAVMLITPRTVDSAVVDACWGRGNTVETTFHLSAASDLWKVFPNLGKAPVVARDSRPADVVVFKDPFVISLPNLPGEVGPQIYTGVVCVLNADGEPRIFADVSREGYMPPVGP